MQTAIPGEHIVKPKEIFHTLWKPGDKWFDFLKSFQQAILKKNYILMYIRSLVNILLKKRLKMKKTDEPIIIEQTFNVSRQELWSAITELNHMTKWFFENIKSFEPKVGFETNFIVKNENRIFAHLWRITEVKPGESITFNWRYEGYEGDSFVSFYLSEYEGASKLMLTHNVTDTFSQNIQEFKRENCIEGWNWFIKKRLKKYLEK